MTELKCQRIKSAYQRILSNRKDTEQTVSVKALAKEAQVSNADARTYLRLLPTPLSIEPSKADKAT